MRQVFYDTETTGLDPKGGDRIIEIAMVEAIDGVKTGRHIDFVLDPEGRRIAPEASAKNGFADKDVVGKPKFKEVWPEIEAFMQGAEMIAHNGEFDIGMFNAELARINHPKTFWELCVKISDTMAMSKRVFPKKRHNLDDLCKNLGVSTAHRTKHGALVDTELTVAAYKAMIDTFPDLAVAEEDFQNPPPRNPVVRLTSKPSLVILQAKPEEVSISQAYFAPAATAASKPKP